MKTNSIFYPGIKPLMALVILISSFRPELSAQANTTNRAPLLNDITVNTSLSGNGFGVHYTPMAGFRINNRMTLSAGPMLRMKKSTMAGWIGHFRFNLLNPDKSFSNKTTLYLFACHKIITNQHFSENWVETEKWISRKETIITDFEDISFKGFESALGFGVTHNFTERLSLGMELGLSVYKVSRNNYQNIHLYHQSKDLNNQFSLVIRLNLGK